MDRLVLAMMGQRLVEVVWSLTVSRPVVQPLGQRCIVPAVVSRFVRLVHSLVSPVFNYNTVGPQSQVGVRGVYHHGICL